MNPHHHMCISMPCLDVDNPRFCFTFQTVVNHDDYRGYNTARHCYTYNVDYVHKQTAKQEHIAMCVVLCNSCTLQLANYNEARKVASEREKSIADLTQQLLQAKVCCTHHIMYTAWCVWITFAVGMLWRWQFMWCLKLNNNQCWELTGHAWYAYT